MIRAYVGLWYIGYSILYVQSYLYVYICDLCLRVRWHSYAYIYSLSSLERKELHRLLWVYMHIMGVDRQVLVYVYGWLCSYARYGVYTRTDDGIRSLVCVRG